MLLDLLDEDSLQFGCDCLELRLDESNLVEHGKERGETDEEVGCGSEAGFSGFSMECCLWCAEEDSLRWSLIESKVVEVPRLRNGLMRVRKGSFRSMGGMF